MRQPSISELDLWSRLEARLLALIALALDILQQRSSRIPLDEILINRELRLCMDEANCRLCEYGQGLDHLPMLDCKVQPSMEDEDCVPEKDKIPDFQWDIYDNSASPEQRSKQYHIECKRLGLPSSRSWVLNTEYVNAGICRFIEDSHKYGKSCRSGAMVGYVQDMEPDAILAEVNVACRKKGVAELALPEYGWQPSGTSRLDHQFRRPFPESPFDLRHLWIDLRRHYASEEDRTATQV